MRIFVSGATGVLGRRAVPGLLGAGHDVTALARRDADAERLGELGARPVRADLFDTATLLPVLEGHDTVVNLATRIPEASRMMLPGAWRENDRLRTQGVANLVAAAARVEASRFVQESVTFLYADGGDRWLDESSPLSPESVTASARDAERTVQNFSGDGVVLRFALLVAPESPHGRDLVASVTKGYLPLLGDPHGYETFVHADDAAEAVVAALEVEAGVYNVSEDEPSRKVDHAAAWSAVTGREVKLPPALLAKLPRARLRARSQRVANRHLREASLWRPQHPRLVEEWARIATEPGGEVARRG
ncbi:MAG: NAD(P)H-binding protein [Actinobacteria bacterium]|nr:NAD(P)H-binding protein [Actinomycetota bacterium]